MASTRTITVSTTETGLTLISIDGLTNGPRAGWKWNPTDQTLRNPRVNGGFRLNDIAAAQMRAAIRDAVPGRVDSKTPMQLQRMPKADRAAYRWNGNEDEAMYVKYVEGAPATFQLARKNVELLSRGPGGSPRAASAGAGRLSGS